MSARARSPRERRRQTPESAGYSPREWVIPAGALPGSGGCPALPETAHPDPGIYASVEILVGTAGFEPAAFGPPDRHANQTAPRPVVTRLQTVLLTCPYLGRLR